MNLFWKQHAAPVALPSSHPRGQGYGDTWGEETNKQHGVEGVSVQPLADPCLPEQLPCTHAIITSPRV